MSAYSLDTDIITKLLKKHPGNQPVVDRFREEIRRNSLFLICPVVCYKMMTLGCAIFTGQPAYRPLSFHFDRWSR
jgi:hypothetical protein